jgi:hypothetical protein
MLVYQRQRRSKMNYLLLFLSGLFFANSIPHFVNGISGKEFATPFIHRFFKNIPSPLFNVIWGLANICLAFSIFNFTKNLVFGFNLEFLSIFAGFAFASVGLSIFFFKGGHKN